MDQMRKAVERVCYFLQRCIPPVMNPHGKIVQRWSKLLLVSCLFAAFVDPLFFFLLTVLPGYQCISLAWSARTIVVVLRSATDFIYLIHILLQFRMAYVAPESTVTGVGDLVHDPRKIARHYLSKYFVLDVFVVLPVPQMIMLWILPKYLGTHAIASKDILCAAIFIQYIPRLYRFLSLLAGQSSTGLIFESEWANIFIYLLTYICASHLIGSCWYLLGLQRVNQCLEEACMISGIKHCMKFVDCGSGDDFRQFKSDPAWALWMNDRNAAACFSEDSTFDYGIFEKAINLTTNPDLLAAYWYSFFWGFQQVSTLAGNQVPSDSTGEIMFTMAIIGVGLLLFALLIGNVQNFLQSLGRRRLEMSLRRRDVERWMSHRCLPDELRRRVREAEGFNWAATRGVNEQMLMENLPDDIQRDIRRHLFQSVKNVRLFQLLDEPIVDAVCERLRTKTYIRGCEILYQGCLVDKIVFIIRGKMESIGENGNKYVLSEGDVCGEELLTWCLEHSSGNRDGRIRTPGARLLGSRKVTCSTNVEAFVLGSADLEEVIGLFQHFLRSPMR